MIGLQVPHRARLDRHRLIVVLLRVNLDEMLEQDRDVVHRSRRGGVVIRTTFSRKNRSSRNFPSFTSARGCGSSRHQPHVDRDRLGAADPLEAPGFDEPQQLHLDLGPDLADLVEKHRAAVRRLEPAFAPLRGAGERPALVPEQFASSNIAGRAAQWTGTKGARARGLAWWMAWAINSLPCRSRPRSGWWPWTAPQLQPARSLPPVSASGPRCLRR